MCDDIKTACLSERRPTTLIPAPRPSKMPTEHRSAPRPRPGRRWHGPAHQLNMSNVRDLPSPFLPLPLTQGAEKGQKTTNGVCALEAAEMAEIKELLQ